MLEDEEHFLTNYERYIGVSLRPEEVLTFPLWHLTAQKCDLDACSVASPISALPFTGSAFNQSAVGILTKSHLSWEGHNMLRLTFRKRPLILFSDFNKLFDAEGMSSIERFNEGSCLELNIPVLFSQSIEELRRPRHAKTGEPVSRLGDAKSIELLALLIADACDSAMTHRAFLSESETEHELGDASNTDSQRSFLTPSCLQWKKLSNDCPLKQFLQLKVATQGHVLQES